MSAVTATGAFGQQPAFSLVMLTPALAQEWLEVNVDNRRLRQTQVDALARDMTHGKWQLTGDTIKFDVDGNMIDGQHRCWAVVESEVTVPVYAIRGLPKSVRDVVDTNVPRTASDVLSFSGRTGDTTMLAAGLRIAMWRAEGSHTSARSWVRTRKFTNSEILEFGEAHPEYEQSIQRARASYHAIGVSSKGLWLYALTNLTAADYEDSLLFESSLVEMRTSDANDPRATLLRWLRDTRGQKLTAGVSQPRTLFAIYRTWNAWRSGKSLAKIQIGEDAVIPTLV